MSGGTPSYSETCDGVGLIGGLQGSSALAFSTGPAQYTAQSFHKADKRAGGGRITSTLRRTSAINWRGEYYVVWTY